MLVIAFNHTRLGHAGHRILGIERRRQDDGRKNRADMDVRMLLQFLSQARREAPQAEFARRIGGREGRRRPAAHGDVVDQHPMALPQEQRQDRQRERRGLELGQPDPRRGGDPGGVDVTENQREHVARDHRDEDREPADHAAEEREHAEGQEPAALRLGDGGELLLDDRPDVGAAEASSTPPV